VTKTKAKRRVTKKITIANSNASSPLRNPIVKKELDDGYQLGKLVAGLWNSQKNPPKVYPFGRRVHHGEIGLLGSICGVMLGSPSVIGFFKALMDDDIHDKDQWFRFEKLEII
jgi:hypothetical protein